MPLPPLKQIETRPKSVTIAVHLLYLVLAISVTHFLLAWSIFKESAQVDFLEIFVIDMFGWAFSLFIIGKIGNGVNWARIFFLISFVIFAPINIVDILSLFHSSIVVSILLLIELISNVIILRLLFGGGAYTWFHQQNEK